MENSKQIVAGWISIGKGRNTNIRCAFTFIILQIDVPTMIITYRSMDSNLPFFWKQ